MKELKDTLHDLLHIGSEVYQEIDNEIEKREGEDVIRLKDLRTALEIVGAKISRILINGYKEGI